MPVSRTDIPTANAARYLTRLCGHAGKMSSRNLALRVPHRSRVHGHPGAPPRIQQIDRDGGDQAVLLLDCGQVTLTAGPDRLIVTAEAADQVGLERVQDLIADRLLTFAAREQLSITWYPAAGTPEPG